jgi:hypothetical protein
VRSLPIVLVWTSQLPSAAPADLHLWISRLLQVRHMPNFSSIYFEIKKVKKFTLEQGHEGPEGE